MSFSLGQKTKKVSKALPQERLKTSKEAGFMMVEAVCAMAVLTIGLLGTAVAISSALKFTRISRNVSEAKTMALAQIEEIHALRDSRRLNFRQIANTGDVNNTGSNINFTGFVKGYQQVADSPGADGVNGTDDDPPLSASSPSALFSRQTVITSPLANLKKIIVTVKYPGPDGIVYQLNCTSYINNDLKQQ